MKSERMTLEPRMSTKEIYEKNFARLNGNQAVFNHIRRKFALEHFLQVLVFKKDFPQHIHELLLVVGAQIVDNEINRIRTELRQRELDDVFHNFVDDLLAQRPSEHLDRLLYAEVAELVKRQLVHFQFEDRNDRPLVKLVLSAVYELLHHAYAVRVQTQVYQVTYHKVINVFSVRFFHRFYHLLNHVRTVRSKTQRLQIRFNALTNYLLFFLRVLKQDQTL